MPLSLQLKTGKNFRHRGDFTHFGAPFAQLDPGKQKIAG